MRTALILYWLLSMPAFADEFKISSQSREQVTRVATALDHLTVLEFGEQVTMAAAGSDAFQIERHDNKVFIRPLKTGASTDLFVWTASRRFTYELQPPGEVKEMNFALDTPTAAPKSPPDSPHLDEVAETMLTQAFLGVERIDTSGIKDNRQITVRIEHVLRSKNSVYIHYSVRNRSARPFRVSAPLVAQAFAPRATVSLAALQYKQLDIRVLHKLGQLTERSLTPARTEVQKQDLQLNEETHGVLVLRTQVSSPSLFHLTFPAEGSHDIQGFVVF